MLHQHLRKDLVAFRLTVERVEEHPDPGLANYTESPDKTSVSFMYNGNITAIIDKLHLLHLDDVLLEEPSLEEIFMHYYA